MKTAKYDACRNFVGFKLSGTEYEKLAKMAEEDGVSVNMKARELALAALDILSCNENIQNGK